MYRRKKEVVRGYANPEPSVLKSNVITTQPPKLDVKVGIPYVLVWEIKPTCVIAFCISVLFEVATEVTNQRPAVTFYDRNVEGFLRESMSPNSSTDAPSVAPKAALTTAVVRSVGSALEVRRRSVKWA